MYVLYKIYNNIALVVNDAIIKGKYLRQKGSCPPLCKMRAVPPQTYAIYMIL